MRAIFCWITLLTILAYGPALVGQTPAGQTAVPAVTGNKRVDALLGQMTLQEKIAMIHGAAEPADTDQAQAGYLPGIPRLGIPSLRLADGPPGVLTRVPSTAPTATMGLAATFSRDDAEQNGIVIAREARALGMDVVLEPFINIDRDFRYHRGYNTFGEDPLLTGEIGAAEIRGIQGQGVMSQAKHYVAYDSDAPDISVDQQALREIYVAPFAAASDAGVSSIMCSYNKVNGEYSCGNPDALTKILRDEVGFQGFVTSDWGATHANTFINAGLDLEMPGPIPGDWVAENAPSYFDDAPDRTVSPHHGSPSTIIGGIPEEPRERGMENPLPRPFRIETMRSALRSGAVSEATITRAVGRILLQMDRFGLLDGKSDHSIKPRNIADNAKAIQKTSEDAAVLLKNDGHALPLRKRDLESLALIGPGAGQTIAVGLAGEKAVGLPERQIGTVDVIRKYTAGDPNVHLTYAVANDMTGTPIPAEFLSHNGQPGLERMAEKTGAGAVDPQLAFTRSKGTALPEGSYHWKGQLVIPSAGVYRLYLQVLGAFSNLRVDGIELAANWRMGIHGDITQAGQDNVLPTTDGLDNLRIQLDLAARAHDVEVTVVPDTSHSAVQVRLNWVTPEQQKANYLSAIAAAKSSGTAVVFAWSRGEPDFALPGDQDRLIEEVAAVNPNTIVVLNVSQPVAMPWLSKVKAVLQMWWPGDEGGFATTNVLLGKVSPAGRLPFTWPRKLQDTPAGDPAYPERSREGVNKKTTFSEGIYVGYRWFDRQKIEPLFPFGYGLSYTQFEYSALEANRSSDGGLDLSFDVKNTGTVVGNEVPQVYLGAPADNPPGAQMAVRSLIAFNRVSLKPGETRTVRLHVPLRRLQYWSTREQKWMVASGARTLYVGASSRDLRLEKPVSIVAGEGHS